MIRLVDAIWRTGYRAAYLLLRVWWKIRTPTHRGAYVALWRGDDLLLIRNSYRGGVTVPCGNIDRGESPREAARRELEEEVGIRVDLDALEFACDFDLSFEAKTDHAYFFELQSPPDARIDVRIDRREVIWADFCPRGSLDNVALAPHVRAYLKQRERET
jgi:8-oxo-dGTP diphosphatase